MIRRFLPLLFVMQAVAVLKAAPVSGDVYREYNWRPEYWQRVTAPDVTYEAARNFLPNKINKVQIDDLDKAIKSEAVIELLLCHPGTVGHKIRVNEGPWLDIPKADLIPGNAGSGSTAEEYQFMRYPIVEVPLEHIKKGENTFEFSCGSGVSLGKWWPQSIIYGVTFRIYYDKTKAHPKGKISEIKSKTITGDSMKIEVEVSESTPVKQVDVIGLYEDFNWEGDGNYYQWHYRYLYGQIYSHIGTAAKKPYQIEWDCRWLPEQKTPMKILARLVDDTNLCYLTEPVDGISLDRGYKVVMYKPYNVPPGWSTRNGKTQKASVMVEDDLTKAVEAKVVMCTWNGLAAEEIGVNDTKVITNLGKDHCLSYDAFAVPLELLRRGENTLYTHSKTKHHGIEVQWPGMVLFVKYKK